MLDVKNEVEGHGAVILGIPKNFEKKRFRVFIGDSFSVFLFSVRGDRCVLVETPNERKTIKRVPSSFKIRPYILNLPDNITIYLAAKKNAYPKMIIHAPKHYKIKRAIESELLPDILDPSIGSHIKINY